MKCRVLLLFVLGSLVVCSLSATVSIVGTVFEDRNGNGVRDPGEVGVAQVAISNGSEIVLTKPDGTYSLPLGESGFIFVIKPRGWRTSVNAQNLPQFYHHFTADSVVSEPRNFALTRSEEPDRFRILALTDTQPANPKEVEYLDRTIVDGLVGRNDIAFGVTLGDIVFDRHDLYPAVNAALARIGTPWYPLAGNHDLNLDATDDRKSIATFESVYGPSTFAFHYAQVLFIALNDVRFPVSPGGYRYAGGLRDDQFNFVENILRITPKDELVVLLIHIPLFNDNDTEMFRVADRSRLFTLLQDRPHTFSISGHTHYQRHFLFGAAEGWKGATPHHQYNVAAADGGFWGGPPDANGIPIATMWDGTPHGYGIVTFDHTNYQIEYRPARYPADYQMAVHSPAAIRAHQSYISIYANVFNGYDAWKIETRVDDRPWASMRRTLQWDPEYAKAYLAQDDLTTPLPGLRLPDPVPCPHLWKSYLPSDLAVGLHTIEVRATDPYERAFTEKRALNVLP